MIWRWLKQQESKLVLILICLLLIVLFLMSLAVENSTQFSRYYIYLYVAAIVGLLSLTFLVGSYVFSLIKNRRHKQPGARLTSRLVRFFVILAIIPLSILFLFSIRSIEKGIDTWFDVQVQNGLQDAIELSKEALDFRMREARRASYTAANTLIRGGQEFAPRIIDTLRENINAQELTFMTDQGQIVAFASRDTRQLIPQLPSEALRMHARQGNDYVSLEPLDNNLLQIRVVTRAMRDHNVSYMTQVLFEIPVRFSHLANSTENAYTQYQQLLALRAPLKNSFRLTLSMVLMLTVLSAIGGAIFAAQNFTAPIRDLVDGTQAVADGMLDQKIPSAADDELGGLVDAFNQMITRLSEARDEANYSQQQVEGQRAYLEIVLARLSSGVLTLDHFGFLRTTNDAATQILKFNLFPWKDYNFLGSDLSQISQENAMVGEFFTQLQPFILGEQADWRQEISLFHQGTRQVLSCRGSLLRNLVGLTDGYVIVFDDITHLVQAEREAAWGEVARRLAHEIKNPLTPIQLSAERMQHKLAHKLASDDSALLERGVATIVQQVSALKEMVDAFSQYARPPKLHRTLVHLNEFVQEVMHLYEEDSSHAQFLLQLDARNPTIWADKGRLRQLIHNLVKNALEALKSEGDADAWIQLSTQLDTDQVEFKVRDSGPGFPAGVSMDAFEPYVTTKPKGSGLGLAIVRKIAEEHGGSVQIESPAADGYTCIQVRFPLPEEV